MSGAQSENLESSIVDSFSNFYEKYYDERIRHLSNQYEKSDIPSLTIDFRKLKEFNSDLTKGINNKPDIFYTNAEHALSEYLNNVIEEDLDDEIERADLRLENHGEYDENIVDIRDIRSKHSNEMITIEGIVKTASRVLPRVTNARFICRACRTRQSEKQPTSPDSLKYPFRCRNDDCGERNSNSFHLDKRESEQIDFQKLIIEEAPEDLKGGRNPESVDCFIQGDITGEVTPGDRISLTGILRLDDRNDNPVLSRFIEGNNIQKEEKKFEEIEISDEEEEQIIELSKSENLHNKIAKSVAPTIKGYRHQKMAVGAQLFSGVSKDTSDTSIRGDIHILMVGDPGTGKSVIIESAKKLAPRGVYTVGKGSSAAGLTASAVKDSDMSGEQKWSLEAGALVLADKGLACVDEIDKMKDDDRSALHEALEQQSYHYDTEVLLANGERRKIGELVNELMEEEQSDVVDAVDCEILDMDDGELRLHTVDLENGSHEKISVDRVSRHEAPEQMVEVTFSNGRSITVTPEHPLYATENGEFTCIDAINAKEGTFVPAPRHLPNSSTTVPLQQNEEGLNSVQLPDELTLNTAELLGHLTAEGNSYTGNGGYTIEYTNSDSSQRERFKQLVQSEFGPINLYYNQNGESTPSIRLNSKRVYQWFEDNHPEFLEKSEEKRIPSSVMGASSEHIRRFLVGAYSGCGSVASTATGITTKSKKLAEDYADAMLKIGVSSRLVEYTYKGTQYYKTLVKGDSNTRFFEKVVEPSKKSVDEAKALAIEDSNKHHDVLPTDFIEPIRRLRKSVGLTNDGSLHSNIECECGVQMSKADRLLTEVEERIDHISKNIWTVNSFSELREVTGWSQEQLADVADLSAPSINHIENENGYTETEQTRMLIGAIGSVQSEISSIADTVSRIRDCMKVRFERITDVQVIDNTGEDSQEWVYDLTVEPTRTFVGQGVVLHNTVSVNKAGINATLKSRCSLLAAANPTYGRFDEYEPIGEQIDLEPALISRFDLIFTIQDKADEERDAAIADHLLDVNEKAANDSDVEKVFEDTINPELLRKYIAYARQNYNPVVTGEQKESIRNFYTDLRNHDDENLPISVTAREVPSMIRLSEAIARMNLRDKVLPEDIKKAKKLKNTSLHDVGEDPETGELDAGMIESGITQSQRKQIQGIKELLSNMEAENDEYSKDGIPREKIYERADEALGMGEDDVDKRMDKLQRKGDVYEPNVNKFLLT